MLNLRPKTSPMASAAWETYCPNSRTSHARASFQSRMTLCGEICKTSAASSTLNPPKKRSPMTRAFRASTRARSSSA